MLFAEANQAVFRDDLKAALAKYRELYRKNPEFLRGRLDLARLLFIDKQNKESAALFDGIDIPEVPAVNEKIKVFADALKKRDAWSGSVSFGAGYDTNLKPVVGARRLSAIRQAAVSIRTGSRFWTMPECCPAATNSLTPTRPMR